MRGDKVLERIRKLLDMAEDASSPNEAVIAARRARSLMDKHQITKEDLLKVDDSTFATTVGDVRVPYVATWIRLIAGAVARLNDCQAIIARRRGEVRFEFNGFSTDAVVAKHTHDYLISTCQRMLERSCIKGRSNRNYYRVGFAQEISWMINEIVTEREELVTSSGKSLVLCKREMVDAHFDDLPAARSPNIRRPCFDEMYAVNKGREDARRVSLSVQVESDQKQAICG